MSDHCLRSDEEGVVTLAVLVGGVCVAANGGCDRSPGDGRGTFRAGEIEPKPSRLVTELEGGGLSVDGSGGGRHQVAALSTRCGALVAGNSGSIGLRVAVRIPRRDGDVVLACAVERGGAAVGCQCTGGGHFVLLYLRFNLDGHLFSAVPCAVRGGTVGRHSYSPLCGGEYERLRFVQRVAEAEVGCAGGAERQYGCCEPLEKQAVLHVLYVSFSCCMVFLPQKYDFFPTYGTKERHHIATSCPKVATSCPKS